MSKKNIFNLVVSALFIIFICYALITGYKPGIIISKKFIKTSWSMLRILPFAFIIIGLFEVWVKRSVIEKHMGNESGLRGHFWALVLSMTTIGGLYISFPVAYSIYRKGASIPVILTYITASAVCRVPMTIFETTFMGLKFSIIRLSVAIPLIVLSSVLFGKYLEKKGFKLTSPSENKEEN